jgi:hypothetical protein
MGNKEEKPLANTWNKSSEGPLFEANVFKIVVMKGSIVPTDNMDPINCLQDLFKPGFPGAGLAVASKHVLAGCVKRVYGIGVTYACFNACLLK